MNKKSVTLIIMLALTGYISTNLSAGAVDSRIAQIEDAFTPSASQTQVDEEEASVQAENEKGLKKFFKFKKKDKEDVKAKSAEPLETAESAEEVTSEIKEQTENAKEKTAKKKFNLKFWGKKQQKKEGYHAENRRSFSEAKKYAEDNYKERTEAEKNKKKNKRLIDKKVKPEKAQDIPKEIEVKLDKNTAASTEQSTTTMELKTKDGKKVVTGSVSANKIISVEDCVRIAMENNPSIVSQMMSRDIYKNKVAQAWADYFPTINAGVSYSKNDMLMTNFKFPMQKYDLWNTPSLGVNMLLFDFGKTAANAKIAKKTFEASEENLQGNVNDIIFQVKSAYYNLLYAVQQVEVYEDTVANYDVHLKQAKAYYDIGSKAKIDVTTAAYNLENAKLSLIQAKNSVDIAYAQLNNAMGVPEFADYEIKEKLTSRKYDVIFEDAMETAYEQRPALLSAKKKMEASQVLVKSAKIAFLPNVNAFGNFTQGGKNPSTDYGYQIGGQIAYQNLNLMLLKNQVDEAKMTYLKDKADYEVQRQSVYLEVKQAYIQFKNAQESIPVAKASMLQAKEQYDLASGRYKVGMGDAVELKDAENTYRNSQLSYYNTLTQYNTSAANLEKAVGAPILPGEKL